MNIRIGQGNDIHKLVKGRRLLLGGVDVPYKKGLLGHSDGDVLLHAISDALLGAAALGDLGTYFPGNSKFKDISSDLILKKVYQLISEKGWKIINLDATIILEEPRLSPYILGIRQNISQLLNLPIDAISVKAKTKEKLDSVGKGLAIEVFSVILISNDPNPVS